MDVGAPLTNVTFALFLINSTNQTTNSTTISDEITDISVPLKVGSNFLYSNPSDTKVACYGDAIVIECKSQSVLAEYGDEPLPEIFGLLLTKDDGSRTVIGTSTTNPIQMFDPIARKYTLLYEEANKRKRFNYTCIYNHPPKINNLAQIERCVPLSKYYVTPDECFIRTDLIALVKYQQCTSDEPETMTVWEGKDVALRCNGDLGVATVQWLFEGDLTRISTEEFGVLWLREVTRSQSGVYTCYSFNHATKYYNKHHIDLEVIPRPKAPFDVFAEQNGDEVLVSWKSDIPFRDNADRPRPKRINVDHIVWYAPIENSQELFSTMRLKWKSVNVARENNVTLTNVSESDLYAVMVTTNYNGITTVFGDKAILVKLNSLREDFQVQEKLGDEIDTPCGPKRYRHMFSENPNYYRHCKDTNGKQLEIQVFSKVTLSFLLPEYKCSYKCNGTVSTLGPAKQPVQMDFSFKTHVLPIQPDPSLPPLENVRCSSRSLYSFSISWSTANQTSSSAALNVTLLLLGYDRRDKKFSTSFASGSFRFHDAQASTSYSVILFVVDGDTQGRAVARTCSTATRELED